MTVSLSRLAELAEKAEDSGIWHDLKDECTPQTVLALVRAVKAAEAFIGTMPIRYSHIAERKVPSAFTYDSGEAAIALFDSLAVFTADGEA